MSTYQVRSVFEKIIAGNEYTFATVLHGFKDILDTWESSYTPCKMDQKLKEAPWQLFGYESYDQAKATGIKFKKKVATLMHPDRTHGTDHTGDMLILKCSESKEFVCKYLLKAAGHLDTMQPPTLQSKAQSANESTSTVTTCPWTKKAPVGEQILKRCKTNAYTATHQVHASSFSFKTYA